MANKILPELLNTESSIGKINLWLVAGRVSLKDLNIKQPKDFGDSDLLSLGKATVDVDVRSLIDGPITVESVVLEDLEFNIIRNTNGVLNLASLSDKSSTKEAQTNQHVEEASSESKAAIVDAIHLRNFSISYLDQTYEPNLHTQIENLNLSVTNIIFNPKFIGNKDLPTSIDLNAIFKQADMHDALIGATAKMGILGTNIPAVNAAVRLTGIELKPLQMVVPLGIAQTLGGSCVDIYVDLAMAADILDCKIKVKTADNTMRLMIAGTPSKPIVDKSTALGNVVTRPGAIIGGLVGDVSGAGIKVLSGAGKTTAAVGSGAIKVVGGIGKGLFKTTKGLVTADLEKIKDGSLEATVGTVKKTADTISDTASTAAGSVGDVASTAIGKAGSDAWVAECEERWAEKMESARESVKSAPYPQP